MDLFGDLMSMIGSAVHAKRSRDRAQEAISDANDKIDSGNWNATYTSNLAPTYQREQSPVARAYLESFLTGTNPDAIQGTRYGSDYAKQGAQQQFNAQTGGWDALRAKQDELDNDPNRYKVRNPADFVAGAPSTVYRNG